MENEAVERPRWDIYDGLWMPMVAPFKKNRRIMAGWLECGGAWGGSLVFRELIQYEDGTLGMKWPEEMIPETKKNVPIRKEGGLESKSLTLDLESKEFTIVNLVTVTADVLISMQIEPKANIEAFGINFLGKDGYKDGCELQFIPSKKQAQWNTPKQAIPSPPLITFPEIINIGPYTQIWESVTKHPDLLHVPFKGKDFAITGVERLDKPFTLDIIVKKQKNGTYILDACIDERRTLITWRTELNVNKIALFARNGKVSFKNVIVKPLK